jgi:polyisoprenoid-binding protein YceI
MHLSSLVSRLCTLTLLASGLTLAAGASEFSVDQDHSAAIFQAGHFGVSHVYGRFPEIGGTLTIESDASKDAFEIHVTAASLTTHQDKRDQHLRGPDFFDVKQFPTLSFKSTSVAQVDDKTLEVTGNLTIHGVTKTVTVKVVKVGEGKVMESYRVGYETSFVIKRSEFGMTAVPAAVVGEDVTIIVAVEGIKK